MITAVGERRLCTEGSVPNASIINSIGRVQKSTLHRHSFCSAFVLVKGRSFLFHADCTARKAGKYHDHQCEHRMLLYA